MAAATREQARTEAQATLIADEAVAAGDAGIANPASDPKPLHASKCPAACTQHGTCHEELGRCDCPLGRSGPDCSVEEAGFAALCAKYGHSGATCAKADPSLCINACNFRGKCAGGFCHCKPGTQLGRGVMRTRAGGIWDLHARWQFCVRACEH